MGMRGESKQVVDTVYEVAMRGWSPPQIEPLNPVKFQVWCCCYLEVATVKRRHVATTHLKSICLFPCHVTRQAEGAFPKEAVAYSLRHRSI